MKNHVLKQDQLLKYIGHDQSVFKKGELYRITSDPDGSRLLVNNIELVNDLGMLTDHAYDFSIAR